jgi:MFS family permease
MTPGAGGHRSGDAAGDRLGRSFWTLVASSGLSNLADGVLKVALPLVAVRLTRSPASVAGLEAVRTLPWLLLSLQAGALVDRWDRRRTMLVSNTVRAVMMLVAVALLASGQEALWVLYVVAVGTGVAEVFNDTAAQTILPSVTPRSLLGRANGRLYAVELGAQQFAGPPLAGALVAAGAVLAFGLPAGLWGAAVVALLLLRGSHRAATVRPAVVPRLRSDIAEGLRFLRAHELLRTMAAMVGVLNLAAAATAPLFVLFAVGPGSVLGLTDPQFGLLLLVAAAGGLLGSVACEPIERWLGTARTVRISIVTMTVMVAVPAVTTSVVPVAVAFGVGGLGTMLWNIPTVSFRQHVTPGALLGRVNASYRLLAWGTLPVGAAVGGLLGEVLGLRGVFVLAGVASLALLVPARRLTDDALAPAQAEASDG